MNRTCTEATADPGEGREPRSGVPDPAAAAPLEPLRWLSGEWVAQDREEGTCTWEEWLVPRGSTMMGASSTVTEGRTVAWEHLRLEARAEGIFYVATPSGQQATAFRLVEEGVDTFGADYAVFENPEHDFPVRISYRREGSGLAERLTARIEGREPSRTAEWVFRSDASCPP